MNKSDDEVRQNFLKTLKSRNMLSDQPSIKEQTIIIFDWDDTLLCTTFLGKLNSLADIEFRDREQVILSKIDSTANQLLLKSCEFGDPLIITNAAKNWVEYSSKIFMPKTHETLIKKKIQIISARSNYEGKFPGDAKRWKHETFLEISKNYMKNIITNIICLGDSTIEMDAAKELAKKFKINCIKTIKFEENPTPSELIKQQQLVTVKFEQIFYCLKSKMIKLEKKKGQVWCLTWNHGLIFIRCLLALFKDPRKTCFQERLKIYRLSYCYQYELVDAQIRNLSQYPKFLEYGVAVTIM